MGKYRHHLSAFFAHRDEAAGALARQIKCRSALAQRPFLATGLGINAAVAPGDGWLADLLPEANIYAQLILLAQTRSVAQTAIARDIAGAAVGEFPYVVSPGFV